LPHKAQVAIKDPKYAIRFLGTKFLESRWNELLVLANWGLGSLTNKRGNLPPISDCSLNDSTQVTEFWGRHTVITPQLSLMRTEGQDKAFIEWRAKEYSFFHELMGLWGDHNGEVVLDYGCGPGTDLVGFLLYGNAKKVIGIDVSLKALEFASRRMSLHNIDMHRVELIRVSDSQPSIPLVNNSVDFIYSQGVLHHTSHPEDILKELCRVLKSGKQASIMVYNKQSAWYHLYVAYYEMVFLNRFKGMTVAEAFAKTTDSVDCPISRCYEPEEFIKLCEQAGFKAEFKGGYYSQLELQTLTHYKSEAIADTSLSMEHRDFLLGLSKNKYPQYNGKYAGIGGVYILEKS